MEEFLPLLSPLGGLSLDPLFTRINNVLDKLIINFKESIVTRELEEVEYEGILIISDATSVVYKSRDIVIDSIGLNNKTKNIGRLIN